MKHFQQNLIALLTGFIVALGLGLSGMTQPQKVIAFLDVSDWDPTLIFVMFGAILVHGVAFFLIKRRKTPFFDFKWHLPQKRFIDVKLFVGAAIFGMGWGLGGYCPGPALTALSTFDSNVITFVLAMVAGMILQSLIFGDKTK